ncbi:MAG: 6-phosphofructokinase, partial [Clostridia bacterium]|nr:6-phosphofructokinase [Clostridia bacterium]
MRHVAVLTSGGDAPGMNAGIRAVTRRSIARGLAVTGVRRGFAGLLQPDFVPFDVASVADIVHRGGTVLLTGRTPAFHEAAAQARAVEHLRGAGVDGLV